MTQEQKAKAYDEALKWMRRLYPTMTRIDKEDAEHFFPELRESEDERIRGAIIDHLKDNNLTEWAAWLEKQKVLSAEEEIQGKKDVLWCIKQASKYAKDENEMGTCWFAEKWLEKQCEQKPTDEEMKELLRTEYEKGRADAIAETQVAWSEQDSVRLQHIIDFLWHNRKGDTDAIYQQEQDIDWLKSFRPHNWTKEDKERYISCLKRLSTGNPEQPETINSKWFKEHVYPQKQWKPSKEQMNALDSTLQYSQVSHNSLEHLNSLYNDLKKLTSENYE